MDLRKELYNYIQLTISQYPLSCDEIDMLELMYAHFEPTGNIEADQFEYEQIVQIIRENFTYEM